MAGALWDVGLLWARQPYLSEWLGGTAINDPDAWQKLIDICHFRNKYGLRISLGA
jgi:hypothetical protein